MDAFFSWRRTTASDLAECLKLHPAKNGVEIVGDCRAMKAWRTLFEMKHASRSALVELHEKGKVEIVGFGFGTFVKKSFAEREVLDPAPGLNARVIESIDSGNSVIATYEEVQAANTQGDLQQVVIDTSWKNGRLSPLQVDEVRALLGLAYHNLFSGYNFGRVLWESVDDLDFWHIRGSRVFRVVDRFEGYRQAHSDTKWNSNRAFVEVTAETMREDPHSIASELFHHHKPQFAFTPGEQELLETALDGVDDAAAAKSLFVSVAAIKRRWANIFERVAAMRPDLCPSDGDGTRGIQKRQRVLAYIRNHPEELRPFNFGPPATSKRVLRLG